MAPVPRIGGEDGPPVTAEAIDDAIKRIDRILESPAWLLDPESEQAREASQAARQLMKLFFDAAQARAPEPVKEAAEGLNSLVVDGFTQHQIWEEMEVQNVPLRRHIKRTLDKLAKAPKGSIDLSLDVPSAKEAKADEASKDKATGKKSKAKKLDDTERELEEKIRELLESGGGGQDRDDLDTTGDEGEAKDKEKKSKSKQAKAKAKAKAEEKAEGGKKNKKAENDKSEGEAEGEEKDFFDADEMEEFTKLADQGKLRLNDDSDSDIGLLEMSGDERIMSDDDKELDELLKGETAEGEEESAGEGDEEEGAEADEADEVDEAAEEQEEKEEEEKPKKEEKKGKKQKKAKKPEQEEKAGETGAEEEDETEKKVQSLYEMDRRLKNLEAEVERLEEEQLKDKPWMLRGEVSAKQRPLNSLLEVHLDQPMTFLAGRRAEDAALAAGLGGEAQDDGLEDLPGVDGAVKLLKFDIDGIIRQRIWDETYDDVIRKMELPPSQRPQKSEEDMVETLNFEKSRIGLGEIYAQQYEAEMLGHKTQDEVKDDKEKTEAKAMFAQLMYRLDLLSNMHFTPRPPMIETSDQLNKVAAIKMEETIPLMISDSTLKAPEEVHAPRRHAKDQAELTHEERVAARRSKKEHRKRVLEKKTVKGEMTLGGLREREKKLLAKNTEAKKAKAAQGKIKDPRKRLRSSELLSQAAQNASSDVSRKDELRKERQQRPDGTPTAKKLKL